ncbi:MAG: peptide deformylase [Firmicutes bacterium]|nr:peptide deformylase [Bacillota bacterium]
MEAKKIDKDLEWLRQVSKEVDLGTEDISEDLKVLEEYCLGHGVFAMAAVQLGIPKRLVYIKNTDLDKIEDEEWNEATVLVNPVIKRREGLTQYWEACASCLDNMGLVLRPYLVEIEYFDIKGNKQQMTFEGFPATVFSHEYDHLDGILHMDKALEVLVMDKEERKEFRKEHPYEVFSKDGDFLELEKGHGKRLKN